MARAGQEIDDGNKQIRFVKTSADTGGELLEVEVRYRPGSSRPPVHFHPSQEESFHIAAGSLSAVIDGKDRILRAGEQIVVPAGMRHTMWNPSAEEARVRWETRPALRTEAFFTAIAALYQRGKLAPGGSPRLLDAAALMREFSREFVLASPPPIVQTCVFCVLSPVARALGRHRVWS